MNYDVKRLLQNLIRLTRQYNQIIPLLFLITMSFVVTLNAKAGVANPPSPDLAPGQEWSIRSASPTTAKVIIGRVESWRNTVVVSVSIVDISIPQDIMGAGRVTQIDHMPFERSALAASVNQLIATGVLPLPKFERGYEEWKKAKGGIFTVSVERAIEIVIRMTGRRQI